MTRLRGDAGVVGGVEVLPFGLLTFVVATLIVANAWAVVDARLMVASAAQAAARAYVEAPDQPTAATAARRAVLDATASYGRNPAGTSVQVVHQDGRPWGRCVRATATVHHPIPAIALPWIGGFDHTIDVAASRSEVVDPFRAGLTGAARCS